MGLKDDQAEGIQVYEHPEVISDVSLKLGLVPVHFESKSSRPSERLQDTNRVRDALEEQVEDQLLQSDTDQS